MEITWAKNKVAIKCALIWSNVSFIRNASLQKIVMSYRRQIKTMLLTNLKLIKCLIWSFVGAKRKKVVVFFKIYLQYTFFLPALVHERIF